MLGYVLTYLSSALEAQVTTTLSPSELTQQVFDRLQLTLTAFVANTRRRTDVNDWRNGTTEPNENQVQRLTVALELFDRVAAEDSPDMARLWIIGRGALVRGEGGSPAAAIRFGEFESARASADLFLMEGWL